MNRSEYFDFIEEKLSLLATRIEMRGKLNILDLHLHAENFYRDFFNLLFGWKLENLNIKQQNMAGIDLIDISNCIVIQVSSTATRRKIESSLKKVPAEFAGYPFKFISISKDAGNLRSNDKAYENPQSLKFSPAEDILDVSSLLKLIGDMSIERQSSIYEFIKSELSNEPNSTLTESNLTTIINILAKEDWNVDVTEFDTISYDIENKIVYNQLDTAKDSIDDYKIHSHRIDRIYSDFDSQGVNKSLSILNGIRRMYRDIIATVPNISPDQCFSAIVNRVIEKILSSANYVPMPEEELELCAEVLVVDAFIRCKIFKKPL